jgi:lysozyme
MGFIGVICLKYNFVKDELMNSLLSCVKLAEGFNPYAYNDSLGYVTIGYGFCVDKRIGNGMTEAQASYLLQDELNSCEIQLSHFSWYTGIDNTVRQEALIELCFNMGLPHLLEFKQMIAAIQSNDFSAASADLLNSLWAKQVHETRANNIANRLKNGVYAS